MAVGRAPHSPCGPLSPSHSTGSVRWHRMSATTARPTEIAAGLWACEHGMASLEARTQADVDVFDWDTIAPLTVDALIRGLAPR